MESGPVVLLFLPIFLFCFVCYGSCALFRLPERRFKRDLNFDQLAAFNSETEFREGIVG